MALAVASTSVASGNNITSLTITKPSGVASGDLLVLVSSSLILDTYPVCTGFTRQISVSTGLEGYRESSLAFFYRIADSSDVSASSYSVTGLGTEGFGSATMFRITGWASGNPFWAFDTKGHQITTGSTVSLGGSFSATRPTGSSINIIGSALGGGNVSAFNASWASYSVTSGEANPSWTELQDSTYRVYQSSSIKYGAQAVAYSTSTSTSAISAWNTDITTTGSNTARVTAIFAVIVEPVSLTVDLSQLAAAPSMAGAAANISANTSVSHIDTLTTVEGVETKNSKSGTQWNNKTKPNSVWINKDK